MEVMHRHEDIVRIAAACHEANRRICLAIGDVVEPPWEEADEGVRERMRKGVVYALTRPGATPRDQHNAWAQLMIADGWRWGQQKDPNAKLHPCLVPYEELPEEQRLKDIAFQAIVRTLAGVIFTPVVGPPDESKVTDLQETFRDFQGGPVVAMPAATPEPGPSPAVLARMRELAAGARKALTRPADVMQVPPDVRVASAAALVGEMAAAWGLERRYIDGPAAEIESRLTAIQHALFFVGPDCNANSMLTSFTRAGFALGELITLLDAWPKTIQPA